MSRLTCNNYQRRRMLALLGGIPLACGLLLWAQVVTADTFADNFDSQSYGNQDGSHNWSGNWSETGDDGSPTSGDVDIDNGELHLDDNDNSIARQVDLSGYTSATLSFDYREESFEGASDYVDLEIRTGGGSWNQLQRFAGPADDSGNFSTDISAYLATDTEIRFITSGNFSDFDDFYVDNLIIDAVGSGTPSATYLDIFTNVSYANNDGQLNWAANWQESGDDGDPSGGDIDISGGELHLQDDNNAISRQVDLSLAVSATLSFDYREVSLDDSNEYVDLEIRTGGGGWNFLQRFTGPGDDSGSVSIDISSYMAVDTEIRFITSATTSMNNNDDFYVDNFAVDAVFAVPAVAEYRMDEDSWNGTAGEVLDSSGNGMHGTASGGATTLNLDPAISGNPGTCRYGEFDGTDDYIDAGNISATLNATASLAFWIRTTQTGNDTGWMAPGITGVEENGGADDIFWGWLDASGRIGISVGNNFSTKSTVAINDDAWHHIVLTRDHVAGTFKIYIDGALDNSGAIATGVIGNGYSSIGRIEDTGGSNEYYDGLLDEVRIYDSVLTDAEVSTVMAETHLCNATLCPGETAQGGLIGDYYNSVDLSGGVVNSRVDGPINFNWGSGSPGVTGIGSNQFSIQWNGYIRATETGQYQFRTLSDDGVRLYVDGSLVINNWTDHAVTTDTSSAITLTAGQIYPVVLEFYENFGLAEIRLQWQTPSGGSFVAIPAGPAVLGAGLYSCTSNTVGYYEISHSGTGLTCEAEPITISAYDGGGSAMNPPNGTTITLSTTPSTGTWSGGNTYTFDGSVSSTIQYLRQTTSATLNIDVTDGSASESGSADPDITFTDVGIRFYGDTSVSPLPNQIAGVADPDTVLRVVETSSDTGACVARLQNTNRDVDLGYECRNPTTCSGGQTLSLAGSNVQSNDNGAGIGYTTVNLSFDANGFAAIPFQYSDVGLIRLHSQLDLPAENNDPAVTINGASSEFVVKPDSLVVTSVQSSGGSPNPGTSGGGSGFIAAGDTFEVTVEARNASGARTPGFGRETSPEAMQVNIENLIFPAGGSNGTLNNAAAFVPDVSTPGVYQNISLSWNEVGSMTLLPALTDDDYLGAGTVTGVESGTVGRFYPADFSLLSSTVTNSCLAGGFTYLSDPSATVSYQLQARNLNGAVVSNYDNADLSYPGASISVHAENNNDGTDLFARMGVVAGLWDDGVLSVNDGNAIVARAVDGSLNTVPDGPLTNVVVGLTLADIDGANFANLDFKADDGNNCIADGDCDGVALSGNLNLRFGRLLLQDVHGPESTPIPMVWQTEYWNGSQFVVNSDDQCTQLPLSAVDFVGATTSIDALNDTISVDIGGVTSVFNFADYSGADDCLTASAIGVCDGRAGTFYGATNAIVSYPIDIDLSGLSFLQGDWNQDGNYNDAAHPRVYIRFEHYRGHDRVIYWRERLQ